jgi:hypothetical protein
MIVAFGKGASPGETRGLPLPERLERIKILYPMVVFVFLLENW